MKVCFNFLILALVLIAGGCSKKKDTTTTSATNNSNPYYFRFTLNGVTDTIKANNSISYTFSPGAVSGIVRPDNNNTPYISLQLGNGNSNRRDTIKESDMLNLAGKTIYFSDTVLSPNLIYQQSSSSTELGAQFTTDSTYNIKVSSVTFLSVDNSQQYPARKYVITGTCKAYMGQWQSSGLPTMTGEFKMVITRLVY